MSADCIWALVPAKGFHDAKSRLAPALDDAARAAFAERCLRHVVGTLNAHERVHRVAIISPDEEVRALAAELGVVALTDPNDVRRLNGVIDTGLAAVGGLGATAALVCMADLPHLTAEDLDAVFAESDHDAVIVPDGPEMGTNALYLCPPQRSPTCFGHEESRMLHQARFRAMGMKVAVVRPPGMLRDVDVPRDLPADVVARTAG